MAAIPLYKHPDYVEKYPMWRVLQDCYTGDPAIIKSPEYLTSHLNELLEGPTGQELRRGRERRTRYLNLPELVMSLWISFFFRDKPIYDKSATKLLEKFNAVKNIDGHGTTVTQFMKNILQSYLLFGKSTVMVDTLPIKASSKKAQEVLKLRPYMSMVSVLSTVDWDINT